MVDPKQNGPPFSGPFLFGVEPISWPVQASSRSYMARSVTAAESGRYFGIYALAGRATSFLAPFLVATITAVSDSARLGMAVIILFLAIGMAILVKTPYPADQPVE